MRIIAFCGPKGSGKDTAAKALLSRNSLMGKSIFRQINFADSLKAACKIIFGLTEAEIADAILKEKTLDRWPNVTPRAILQNVAKLFRTVYVPDIWVRAWGRATADCFELCILVTDLRHMEELETLKAMGAIVLYIDNPVVEAARQEGIKSGDPLWSDTSESFTEYLRIKADAIIPNDGVSYDLLHGAVSTKVKELMGDWETWS